MTWAQVGGEWSASHLGHFKPREAASGTHWIVRVGLRDGLEAVEKRKFLNLPEIKLRSLQPVSSRYPDSLYLSGGQTFSVLNGKRKPKMTV
jgi:hypothetical protein